MQSVRGGAAETPGLPPPPLSSIGAAALNQRGLGGLSGRSYHSQPSPPQPTSATVLFPSQSLLDVSLCFHRAPLPPLTREV